MNVRLLVVQGRPQGKSLMFPRGEYLFGRGDECHIRPNSDWVSRQHCLLRVNDRSVVIRDLGSRNGTLVNGSRILGERPLGHGDQVQVGPLVFEVNLESLPPGVPCEPLPAPAQAETGVHCIETREMTPLDREAARTREMVAVPEPASRPTVESPAAVYKVLPPK